MISKEDKDTIKEIFGKMTLDQIMTYNKYFTPIPINGIVHMKVKSLDGARPTIWGDNVEKIYSNVERYLKVSAIL